MDAKKFSSLFLVIIMVLSVIPVMGTAVFATDGDKGTSGDFKYSVISEKEKTCEITKYTGASMSCLVIRLSSLMNRCRRLSGPIPS